MPRRGVDFPAMRNLLFTGLLCLLALTVPACGKSETKGLLEVIATDGSSVGITLDDLNGLPQAQINVDGRVEEGPRLFDVLRFAGVSEFTQVTLTGSSSPVTLTSEQVDDNTILDITNRGTVKLASTYVPKPDWTKDITLITVK